VSFDPKGRTVSHLDRRQALKLFASLGAAGVAAPALAACGGSSLGGESESKTKGTVKLGLLLPQTGVYKTLGDDMTNGFQLYAKLNNNKLGGYEAQVVIADEGETGDSGKAAFDKLLKQEKVLAMSGVVSSAVIGAIKDSVESAQIPLVGSNASPTNLQGVKYIWRTSYVNDEPGIALGKYVADKLAPQSGTVYLIAADYQAGKDEISGFLKTFNGKVEGQPIYTPFAPKPVDNYAPYLTTIKNSNAKAVFCFYAGQAAALFVKQWAEFGLNSKMELYAPGFLTEGAGLLKAQGDAAKNIYTSMNYSPDLDNAANRKFASEYQKLYNTTPTTYAMASYDAAAVLDKALGVVEGDLTSQSLNAAIGKIGQIDSPRGPWTFNQNRTPLQKWYLRQVRMDGSVLTNAVVSELTTLG
jgi:branched-chain amino acid transport system substrate-binding protein